MCPNLKSRFFVYALCVRMDCLFSLCSFVKIFLYWHCMNFTVFCERHLSDGFIFCVLVSLGPVCGVSARRKTITRAEVTSRLYRCLQGNLDAVQIYKCARSGCEEWLL